MIAGYRFRCDTCGKAWITAMGDTVTTARTFASRHGWATTGDTDTCPRCLHRQERR